MDNNQIDKYLRISNKWYKKVINDRGVPGLELVYKQNLIEDFGKVEGWRIINQAPKYINSTCRPNNVNYQESIETPSGDKYFNLYLPLPCQPKEGTWKHVEELFRHVFGEQYELGLDYFQLLYTHPTLHLPVLLLVSNEQGTGKSTFCRFTGWFFGGNVTTLEANQFRDKFDSDWKNKLILYIEEAVLDKPEDMEKIKNLVLQETSKTEAKGLDRKEIPMFLKLIFCSNDESTPVQLNRHDTRFWVRKVPVLNKTTSVPESFDDELKTEIPAFMHFLLHRKLTTRKEDRLWFRRDLLETEAWRNIVYHNSRSPLEKTLPELLLQIMEENNVDELHYTPTDVSLIIENSKCGREVPKDGSSIIRLLRNKWGLSPMETPMYYCAYLPRRGGISDYYSLNKTGRYYKIRKGFLQTVV